MPATRLKQHAARINGALERMLNDRETVIPAPLWEAMRYSLMAGGKRVRPAMMLECHAACGGTSEITPAALSIECMHTYSLIHDDLPCMDDDDLRRGQPTCHRRFDEATAILAGDALQTLAFELLGEMAVTPELAVDLTRRLAVAAGAQGMVGGQVLDMQAESGTVDSVLEVERIHLHKTGTLLRYCCEAGALLAGADATQVDACSRYGKAVGLLFQVADDILDATATTEALGKQAGQDAAQQKATYVSVLGPEAAGELADEMLEMAVAALEPLGKQGDPLRQMARYIRERDQ
ncbi:MAG TPA: farnesyl diphosphate synthase [Mariprofundaceae bacterium]|nr:farnesyl diphosphate synthase [Mariprofundaceae bacterium]